MGSAPVWLWIVFGAVIIIMLAVDLGFVNRKAHAPSYKESLVWSAVWVSLALGFAVVVFFTSGTTKGFEFLAGYIIELSLSVDNLFVFLLVFSYFQVPAKYQHRVLFWGVIGALVMRVIMILLGATLIENFSWMIYVFGAFLVYTGVKMFGEQETEIEPEHNPIVRLVTRFVPITRHYEGDHFFTKVNGKRVGTLLLLVLVIVEVTDLVFAVDSIPAIFGVTTDRFIVYTSNVFAIMGLRTLFFLLAGVIEKFHYLKAGLAFVLTFIGVKMVLPLVVHGLVLGLQKLGMNSIAAFLAKFDHIPITVSLGVVALALITSVVASVIWPKLDDDTDPGETLPADYAGPFEEEDV
ncbi:MAG: TerC family protein [Pyrinomonadaceae bacterium]